MKHLRLVDPSASPPAWLVPPVTPVEARPFRMLSDQEIDRGLGCTCGHQNICIHCVIEGLEEDA